MSNFHYALVRFVPDMARMEPVNFGVILQGAGKLDFRLNPNFARRKGVNTPIFHKWRDFLTEEIRGPAMPLFQPRKDSIEFFKYLAGLCERTVILSRPLAVVVDSDQSFENVLESLFTNLVLPPESAKPDHLPRPTSRFREFEEEKHFRKRGMKRHPYLTLRGDRLWNAYRQVLNGENVVIDKIEVTNQVGLTADEIQKLASGVEPFLERFLGENAPTVPPRYFLLADELAEKFTDQPDEDFHAMKQEMNRVIATVETYGGRVLRQPDEVVELANLIDSKLPALADVG